MIRAVKYAKALDGQFVAVEEGPYNGFQYDGKVYATHSEANKAKGLGDQQLYVDEHIREADWGLRQMIDSASPFVEWREQYDESERASDLCDDLLGQMFPAYGSRSEFAQNFMTAIAMANAVYEEMKK